MKILRPRGPAMTSVNTMATSPLWCLSLQRLSLAQKMVQKTALRTVLALAQVQTVVMVAASNGG